MNAVFATGRNEVQRTLRRRMAITYNDLFLDIRRELKQGGVIDTTLEARELTCFGVNKTREELTRDGRLIARAPIRLAKGEIDRFVAAHEDWVLRNLEKMKKRPPLPEPDSPETEALKAQARAILPDKVAYWSRIMGVQPTGIRITTAKKRYGSCSGKHSLCFSCYLMRSPEAAVDLVVVHELCHIREMNHGPRFYALLEHYLPDWKERKKLLV